MKKNLIAIALFSMIASIPLKGEEINIYQKNYRFKTVFEMESKQSPKGSIQKSVWRWLKPLRDTYDIYDTEGNWQATGIGRIFCLGFFRAWGAEFDVYDPQGARIGVIDGQVVTTESAKYSIYNAEGKRVGIAYMDLTSAGFSIVDPDNSSHILAILRRNFIPDQIDTWTVSIHDETIDPRIIKVFTAFAVDKQGFFKADL